MSALIVLTGCSARTPDLTVHDDLAHFRTVATRTEYPDVLTPSDDAMLDNPAPRSLEDSPIEYWDLTLEEAIHLAMTHSKVMRDLGGTILRTPESVRTSHGPAIQESDPRFGTEAALSAFDAEFSTHLFFEKNDRRLNNRFLGDGGFFEQDYDVFQAQLTKRAATGTQFTLRKNVNFDNDNSLGNEFLDGAWNVDLEAEARHSLLQGGGLNFNRIVGPDGSPGVYNGILIARIRTDISLAEFQLGLRDFISNVENAYWDLYFAYRDLDAKIRARNRALDTWRRIHALYMANRRGGEADKEAQARSQFFRFEEDVQNALAGRPLDGTRTNNGSSPGTFRGLPGVHVGERKLRLLVGLPPTGDRLIRPADEPSTMPIRFDWAQVTADTLVQRAELRRQRWQVKSRELELIASKNFLLPNLDVVGRYRWRGFGERLIDSSGNPAYGPGDDAATLSAKRFDNAFTNLTDGDFQEWQLGLEFSLPIGFRQAHSAVRNAELRLARDKAVLQEQERQVLHDLSNAVAEKNRAYAVLQTNFNRFDAAQRQLAALEAAFEDDKADLFVVLDAQQRLADAESRYFQAQVEYTLGIRNVHFEKGSLLDYCGVVLSEGPWPHSAYHDAAELERLRGRPRPIDYSLNHPPIVSRGTTPPAVTTPTVETTIIQP
ncbi:MAG TPA: TolC family protein [Thermoguttaceae bacterium]|nr:TolC family protein [Thermoguttaceae bacterium]